MAEKSSLPVYLQQDLIEYLESDVKIYLIILIREYYFVTDSCSREIKGVTINFDQARIFFNQQRDEIEEASRIQKFISYKINLYQIPNNSYLSLESKCISWSENYLIDSIKFNYAF